MRIKIVCVIAFLFFTGTFSNKANDPGLSGSYPGQKLDKYTSYASSRKLHLHLNKNAYSAGEVIWFNAYLLNAVTHLPDTARTNVYVDLITANGVIMERRILQAENGVAEGDISLPLILPDGNYLLRAYTDWMKNFGEEFYFTKYFYISNSKYDDMIPRSEVRSNRRFNTNLVRMAEEYNIVFFPEGGDMVQGVNNRIAFKAVDALGRGLDAEGVVVDGAGNEIVRFTTLHAGMGSFELKPEPGSSYKARVQFAGSRPLVFDLPKAGRYGLALRAEKEDGNIILYLFSGLSPEESGYKAGFEVIAHTRGQVIHTESLSLNDGTANTVIPEELFPGGIAHFTIFSEDLVPVAERLVFIDRNESFIFSPNVVKLEHEEQEYLGLQVDVTDREGNSVEGQFSISVLYGDFYPPGSSGNILSNILLNSDLKGVIENPQDYFDQEKGMHRELDHLMMTHGWRRFDWKSVISGDLPELPHSPASSLVVKGRITDPARDEPISNHPVSLKVMSGHDDFFSSKTDGRGYFVFDGLEYPDNFRIEISSQRLAGNYPPDIELIMEAFRGLDYFPNLYTREKQITQRGRDWKRVPEAGRSPYAITSEPGRSSQIYGMPDQTIFIDRDMVTHRTVYDVLVQRATGLQITGNRIMFRGTSSIYGSSEPMFMLDGVQTSRDNVLGQNPREIERIELFRGASAAIFGVRGGAGVIIAYTRQAGDRGFEDSKEYLIAGYHSPREFYSDLIFTSPPAGDDVKYARAVYWNPDLLGGEEEDNTIFFPLPAYPGKMKIVIEGIGHHGGIGSGEFTIELR